MSEDVDCPYCGKGQEINHDDGYGYTEDEVFTQECVDCGKTFTFTTTTIFYYEAAQAPCQNGEEHSLKEIRGYPSEFYEFKRRCEWCNEEVIIDTIKNKEAIESYFKRLDEDRAKKQQPTNGCTIKESEG